MTIKKRTIPHHTAAPRVVLPGSERARFALTADETPAPLADLLTVSVLVCRKMALPTADTIGQQRITHEEFRDRHGADPEAVALVRAFAKNYDLAVAPDTPGPERRTIKLTGTVANMQKAFGVSLVHKEHDGKVYRVREGSITLPTELSGKVEAVLGLDNRPQAKPHFRVLGQAGFTARAVHDVGFARPHATPAASSSYTPVQVAKLYGFPSGVSAAGQAIGIIEFGGGYRTEDLTAYFQSLSQTPPTVTQVLVDNATNSPTTADSDDGEVMLDIEVAAAVAPGAKIVVYFAPNTEQGVLDAVATAIHDTTNKLTVISISWGGPESTWTTQTMDALDQACQSAAALGITITVAAGDNGSTDGVSDGANHVDFPASSPHVLACGGTNLVGNGSSITSEVVWNELSSGDGATGGGFSDVFPVPIWQQSALGTQNSHGRGVPDVAGDADPVTGYSVRVDGQTLTVGGTSAVAPLWAGLIALANAKNNQSSGFIQTAIYGPGGSAAFNDITSGTNYSGTPIGFSAGPGWDACTGLGSPKGTQVAELIKPVVSGS